MQNRINPKQPVTRNRKKPRNRPPAGRHPGKPRLKRNRPFPPLRLKKNPKRKPVIPVKPHFYGPSHHLAADPGPPHSGGGEAVELLGVSFPLLVVLPGIVGIEPIALVPSRFSGFCRRIVDLKSNHDVASLHLRHHSLAVQPFTLASEGCGRPAAM